MNHGFTLNQEGAKKSINSCISLESQLEPTGNNNTFQEANKRKTTNEEVVVEQNISNITTKSERKDFISPTLRTYPKQQQIYIHIPDLLMEEANKRREDEYQRQQEEEMKKKGWIYKLNVFRTSKMPKFEFDRLKNEIPPIVEDTIDYLERNGNHLYLNMLSSKYCRGRKNRRNFQSVRVHCNCTRDQKNV